jgi:hypothetical protein
MPPTAYPDPTTPACAECGAPAMPDSALCSGCALLKALDLHICQRCGELKMALSAEGLCRSCYHLAQRA